LHRRVHAPGLCLAHLPRHRLQRLLVLSPVCLSHAPAPPDPYTLSLHDALPISTRQTSWPGEDPAAPVEDLPITDRDEDFVRFVLDQVAARQEAEDAFFAAFESDTGEV